MMNSTKSFECSTSLDLKKLISVSDNSLILKIKYFKKCKDYTELIKFIMSFMNKFAVKRDQEKINNFVNLTIDFDNIKFSSIDFEFIKMLLPFLENTYPDIIGEILCVNVTSMFKFGYRFIKQFISKDTRNKIKILQKTAQGDIITQTDENLNKIYESNPEIYGNNCNDINYIQNQFK